MCRGRNEMEGVRLFLYANSFATRTILYHADYLFKFRVSEIYLLTENHTSEEKIHRSNNIILSLCERVEDAIFKADMTIALIDENTPENKLTRVIEFSSQVGKKCFVIKNPWAHPPIKETNIISTKKEVVEYSKKPVILLMSTGKFAELYYTELLLNRILFKENISFIQEYSTSTKYLIDQLAQFGIVRESVLQSLDNSFSKASIIIKSISLTELSNELYIDSIKPDYIAMTCLSDYIYSSQLSNLFSYKYGRTIDLVTYLPYIVFEKYEKDYLPIYCNQSTITPENGGIDIYNEHIDRIVKEAVLAKLAIPSGVRIL